MAVQRDDEPNSLAWAYRSKGTCGQDVDGFYVAGVFDNFGSDVPKRTGERGELLVRGVEEFGSRKRSRNIGVGNGWETHIPTSTMTMSLSGSLER